MKRNRVETEKTKANRKETLATIQKIKKETRESIKINRMKHRS